MPAKRKYPEGTKRVSFFCPSDLKTAIEHEAARTGRSETEVIQAGVRRETADKTKPARAASADLFG